MSYADLFARFKPQVRKVTLSVGDVYVRELTGMQQAQLYDDQKKLSQTDWMAKRILMSLCDSDGKLTEKDTDLSVVSLLSFGDIIKLNSAITSLTKEIEEEAEKSLNPFWKNAYVLSDRLHMPVESVLEMPYSEIALWTALIYYDQHPDKRPAATSAESSFEAFKLMMSGKKKHG